ncbi:MAG: acetate--CoA ligase family protein [Candidatus Methanospirare jalkutatii]|nr:acetate--CoA ligase family protein [Candidatus Methanospirare jalkutatii]
MRELERLFNPRTVAVVGATPKEGKVGNTLLRNLLRFEGEVFAVNPKYERVLGVRCFPSLREIPADVDLVVVAVPAHAVLGVLEECASLNIQNVVVISAGFKEAGKEGAALEAELVRICRRNGINLVGPNCLGVISTHARLNATFSKIMPPAGNIALLSQSGALILAVLDWAVQQHIGFSKVVSLGNKAVLDESDFLEFLASDAETDVVALYLESVEDGRRFMRIAEEIEKPVVVLKSGKTGAGARAASSHTGALAGSTEVFNAAMRQCGVATADSLEELFDYASTLSLLRGRLIQNIAIVTNSGGPGVLAADAVETFNLSLANFSRETLKKLRDALPEEANIYNPVDILGDADALRLEKALEIVASDENVDAVLVILTPTAPMDFERASDVLLKNSACKVACFIGGESVKDAIARLRQAGIPNFFDPFRAVRAISVAKCRFRKKKRKEFRRFSVNREVVRRFIEHLREIRFEGVVGVEGFPLLEAYGIPVAPSGVARTSAEAVETARSIGFPVAMKILSPEIVHKSDVGCVKLNLRSEEEVEKAFHEIISRAEKYTTKIGGVLVQKMFSGGREVIVGMKRDMQFGPVVMFGLGGIFVEVFKDVSFRIAPISVEDAFEMLAETKSFSILKGARGEEPSDIEAIAEVLMRISQLCTDFPEITEIDINPLKVFECGCVALDFRMVVRL